MTKTNEQTFSDSEMVAIKEQFNTMDTDQDGLITEKEFIQALKDTNRDPNNYDVQQFFSTADKNKDGNISFADFLEGYQKFDLCKGFKSHKDMDSKTIFKEFDKNGSGAISEKELSQVMAKQGESLDEEQIQDMIQTADEDGDGKVDREEFSKVIKMQSLSSS